MTGHVLQLCQESCRQISVGACGDGIDRARGLGLLVDGPRARRVVGARAVIALLPAAEADNLRVFPSPASTTDASLQLARQVARLVADAKQQIQAAAREAASRAVSSERRLSFEQWEQKFAAGRAEIANETTHAIERFQQEADEHSRMAHAAAAEALRTELPRSMAPQLQQLTRDWRPVSPRKGLPSVTRTPSTWRRGRRLCAQFAGRQRKRPPG